MGLWFTPSVDPHHGRDGRRNPPGAGQADRSARGRDVPAPLGQQVLPRAQEGRHQLCQEAQLHLLGSGARQAPRQHLRGGVGALPAARVPHAHQGA